MKKTNLIKIIAALICIFLLVSFLIFPTRIANGIVDGLAACSNVLIPSLFPFMVISIFLSKSGITKISVNNRFLYYFVIFTMSIIGGYPIGAKILAEEFSNRKISKISAEKSLLFCVNAGPSFIISFVGHSIFASRTIGLILFFCNLSASFTLFLITLPKLEKPNKSALNNNSESFVSSFVSSVSDACLSLLVICGYAILFSGITAMLDYDINALKILNYTLEVTNSLLNTKNIYAAAFLLGFSGLSIICQVLTISKSFFNNFGKLFMYRTAHGLLCTAYAYVFAKITKLNVEVFAVQRNFSLKPSFSGTIISVLFLLCGVCLISSVENKKYKNGFIENVL